MQAGRARLAIAKPAYEHKTHAEPCFAWVFCYECLLLIVFFVDGVGGLFRVQAKSVTVGNR